MNVWKMAGAAFASMFLSFTVIVVWVIFLLVAGMVTERTCLAAGYARSDIDALGNGYCIKRVNHSDVVVPVERAGQ